jgi:hypothetical protein
MLFALQSQDNSSCRDEADEIADPPDLLAVRVSHFSRDYVEDTEREQSRPGERQEARGVQRSKI